MGDVIAIPGFLTATLGFAVYLIGAEINARVATLRQFNIPEPVTGGLLASLVVLVLYLVFGAELAFDLSVRDFLLVLFFAGIGLNARLSDLIAGGKPLLILLVLTLLTILAQNVIGAVGASVFGYPAQAGVLFGSAALIGGHGTAIAWSPEVARGHRAGWGNGTGRGRGHLGACSGRAGRRADCAGADRTQEPQPEPPRRRNIRSGCPMIPMPVRRRLTT